MCNTCGFGPLLEVMKASAGKIEVSPHNPAGSIATDASLDAAATRRATSPLG